MSDRLNPDNWQLTEQKGTYIWFDKNQVADVKPQWFQAKYWQQQDAITGESKGRYTTYFVVTQDIHQQPLSMVLRHYYRGGLISKLSKRSFMFTGKQNTRAYKELHLLSEMHSLGLPVPRPIAAKVDRNHPWSYQNDILIEQIADAQDLFHYLTKQELTQQQWQLVGKTIKQFHQHGVYHSDLNIHNILLDDNGKMWLIDFDRCEFREPSDAWQQANLDRLKRSLNKELSLNSKFNFSADNWQQLIQGYQS